MLRLCRECRGSLLPPEQIGPRNNSWGGWPSAQGLTPYLVLRITIAGEPDAATGFLVNVQELDQVLRAQGLATIRLRWMAGQNASESALLAAWNAILPAIPPPTSVVRLELSLTPSLHYAIEEDGRMILVTQQFEFSAAHRLHCPDLSDEQNLAIFGKCNNPNGHGHNYVLEITLAGEAAAHGQFIRLIDFEHVVRKQVIDRFDHKDLNRDTAEFATLNPTVENITQVVWNLLDGQFGQARLHRVRVYETPKTWAEASR